MTLRPIVSLLCCLAVAGLVSTPAMAQPAWYKKKKQVQEEKKQEQETKQKEKASVDVTGEQPLQTSSLSEEHGPPPETHLLFKKAGAAETLSVDLGNLKQGALGGLMPSAQYSFGWWWTPNLIVGPAARLGAHFDSTFVFMMFNVGPQVRYLLSKRWSLTGYAGYGLGQGLARTGRDSLPPPPSENDLRAQHGIWMSGSISYFFWPKRDLAVGPTLGYAKGSESGGRSQKMLFIGVTFVSGRPNYTGDVTAW